MVNSSFQFEDVWCDLERSDIPRTSVVELTNLASELLQNFDYQTDGSTSFYPYLLPELPVDFGIGLIVGASGTGKSTLLAEFDNGIKHYWDEKAICDHFDNANEAQEKLFAAGLTSVPTWMKPYSVLSNGEKFRADLAASLKSNAVIDEFTSVVGRDIAKSASKSLRKFVDQKGLSGLVIATCHKDIIPFLQPDWIIDTDAGMYCINPRECLRLESMVVEVYEVKQAIWEFFSAHHYLDSQLSPFAQCFLAVIDGNAVAFESVITNPSGTIRDAYREHRLVTHPDYQGLGIGPRFSDYVANLYVDNGRRFFSKTAHPRLGEYRQHSLEWKATSKNMKKRTDGDQVRENVQDRFKSWVLNNERFTYSHEFIGIKNN